jgi:hypothetical protein
MDKLRLLSRSKLPLSCIVATVFTCCSWHPRSDLSIRNQAILEFEAHYALIQEFQLGVSGEYDRGLTPSGASELWGDLEPSHKKLLSMGVRCMYSVPGRGFRLTCSWGGEGISDLFSFEVDDSNKIYMSTPKKRGPIISTRPILLEYARGRLSGRHTVLCLDRQEVGPARKLVLCSGL